MANATGQSADSIDESAPMVELGLLSRETLLRWRDRNLFFGGVSAVEVRSDGALAAAGDPRRGGAGMVVA